MSQGKPRGAGHVSAMRVHEAQRSTFVNGPPSGSSRGPARVFFCEVGRFTVDAAASGALPGAAFAWRWVS